MPCLDVEDTGTLRWVMARGSGVAYLRAGEPLALAAPVQPSAQRLLLVNRVTRLLKRRGLLCARGRRPRGEGRRIWTPPPDNPTDSSLSEQLVVRQGGDGSRDIAQPTTPCPLPTQGSTNWVLYPLVFLVAQRSFKRTKVKDYSSRFPHLGPASQH